MQVLVSKGIIPPAVDFGVIQTTSQIDLTLTQ